MIYCRLREPQLKLKICLRKPVLYSSRSNMSNRILSKAYKATDLEFKKLCRAAQW